VLATAVSLMCVAASRCIIAAHFPHQVFLGLLAGIYCGRKLNWKMENKKLTFMTGLGLLFGGLGFYYFIDSVLGFGKGVKYEERMSYLGSIKF
jgi:hypothetical protein